MDREQTEEGEVLPEYDFGEGVRGKHARAYRQGHTVRVHHPDGTTTVVNEDPLPESHRAELDRRLAELEENPDSGSPWEEVRARLERAR